MTGKTHRLLKRNQVSSHDCCAGDCGCSSSYLANGFSVPGQDGPQIDDLTGNPQFLLSHVGNLLQHVDLNEREDINCGLHFGPRYKSTALQ